MLAHVVQLKESSTARNLRYHLLSLKVAMAPGEPLSFAVSLYATAKQKDLVIVPFVDESLGPLLATGTLNIGQRVWREFISLNMELVPPKPHGNIHDTVPFQLRVEKEFMNILRSVSDYDLRAKFISY